MLDQNTIAASTLPEPWITNVVCPAIATTGSTVTASFTITNNGAAGKVCPQLNWSPENFGAMPQFSQEYGVSPGEIIYQLNGGDRLLATSQSTTYTFQFKMLAGTTYVYFKVGYRDSANKRVLPAYDISKPNAWGVKINNQNPVHGSLVYRLSTIPTTAAIGSKVSITITVKNTGNVADYVRPWVKNNNVNIEMFSVIPWCAYVGAGVTKQFTMQFTMPSYVVNFNLTTSHYAYEPTRWWVGTGWVEDVVSNLVSITPTAAAPTHPITAVFMVYDGGDPHLAVCIPRIVSWLEANSQFKVNYQIVNSNRSNGGTDLLSPDGYTSSLVNWSDIPDAEFIFLLNGAYRPSYGGLTWGTWGNWRNISPWKPPGFPIAPGVCSICSMSFKAWFTDWTPTQGFQSGFEVLMMHEWKNAIVFWLQYGWGTIIKNTYEREDGYYISCPSFPPATERTECYKAVLDQITPAMYDRFK